jgi:hypothetical protein
MRRLTKITKIVNFGCSFAYGNRAERFNSLCDSHWSAATWLSDRLAIPEVNLARPGNSVEGTLDSVLDWVTKTPKSDWNKSLLLVGWTGGHRFGFVADTPRPSNKQRPGKSGSIGEFAFTGGPTNMYRYMIDKWDSRWAEQYINVTETARLNLYRNIVCLDAIATRYKLNIVQYHGLESRNPNNVDTVIYDENERMRKLIDTKRFYRFEADSLQTMTNSNKGKYFVCDDDSHPNHVAYAEWTDKLYDWMAAKDFWKMKF